MVNHSRSQQSPSLAAVQSPSEAPIRVLVVDDSAFMRFAITKCLSEAAGIHVVATARDGIEALDLIRKLSPDVITLDVEMPRLDGLATLREIMANFPRPVIMLSSVTTEGSRETIQALTYGAVDFVPKPDAKANIQGIADALVEKIRRAAKARVFAISKRTALEITPQPSVSKNTRRLAKHDRVVVIGCSTGGPRALNMLVPQLSRDLPAAVLIVQHMPVGFTRSLAERLDSVSDLSIKEANPGDSLEVGRGLIAPGGFHMVLDANGKINLNQNPPVHGVRPSVDVTLASVAQHFGSSSIAVILTGMGNDGTNGAALIRSAGGYVIAEDESTCVVWGMPRSVAEAGIAHAILPLHQIAQSITKLISG